MIRYDRLDLDPRQLQPVGPAPRVGVEMGDPALQAAGRRDLGAVAIGGLELQPFGDDRAKREAIGALEKQRPRYVGADALLRAARQDGLGGATRDAASRG